MTADGSRDDRRRYVDVALPVAAPQPYTYHVPSELCDRAVPGARVVVPLRGRELVGIVVNERDDAPAVRTRPVLATPDGDAALTPGLLRLAEWIAAYYGAPLGLALKSMLPGALWGASRMVVTAAPEWTGPVSGRAAEIRARLERGPATAAALRRALGSSPYALLDRLVRDGAVRLEIEHPDPGPGPKRERVISLSGETLTLAERERLFARAPARRRAYETLEALGGTASVSDLKAQIHVSDAVVRGLVKHALATVDFEDVSRDPFGALPSVPPERASTEEQHQALETIAAARRDLPVLLHGVTGSGKTHVYLELMRRELEAGRGAILLVPEIALTPQSVARVRGVFGDAVGVLHSGLSDGERVEAWWKLRRGEYRVAVGARSAVFAPLERLGLIVMDEEHESTYKQSDAPRYHARDVAGVRGRIEEARVIRGTATPSVESWALAEEGTMLRVTLAQRVHARPLPRVKLVDLTTDDLLQRGPVPWSSDLDVAIDRALERGEQAMVFLNRRGFANFLQCPSCGATRDCPNCSVSLTVHRVPAVLRCHYCTYEAPPVTGCPQCGHAMERMRGLGTQQVEQFLIERYATARVARMDLDTTARKWAHQHILQRLADGEVDILVGTQMIAKGHDFPNVTVVGVIDADVGLHLPDFRAAERTFQLITQVAGRTGRGDRGGVVVVQTRSPDHYALAAASRHDVESFLRQELTNRESPAYPPHVSILRVVVQGYDASRVTGAANGIATWLRDYGARHLGDEVTVLGPAPAPIERIRRRWRWHLLVKSRAPRSIGHIVRAWATRGPPRVGGVTVHVDRDPIAML